MIGTADEIEARLEAWMEEWGLPGEVRGLLKTRLRPAIGFAEGDTETGATRFGGFPELPQGTPWPLRQALSDASNVAARGGSNHDDGIRRYAEIDFPFSLLAQIDLQAVEGFAGASGLPGEGRLLFFYDVMIGPWNDGRRSTRVIWDRSDRSELTTLAAPQAFADMTAREREAALTAPNLYGLPDDEWERARQETADNPPRYVFDPRPARAISVQQLPGPQTLEHDAAVARYMDENDDEYETQSAYEALFEDRESSPLMLGAPRPEQDDPRYDVAITESDALRARVPDTGDWSGMVAEVQSVAADYVVLLEVSLAFLEEHAGGTVTFVIHHDALAARDFDAVTAVYQQT